MIGIREEGREGLRDVPLIEGAKGDPPFFYPNLLQRTGGRVLSGAHNTI